MNEPQAQFTQRIFVPALCIVAASVLLGLAYNNASPLGVHWADSAEPAASIGKSLNNSTPSLQHAPAKDAMATTASLAPGRNYHHETLAMTLVSLSTTQAGIASAKTPSTKTPMRSLSWSELKPLLEAGKVVLVDARGASAYQAGHIPGAVSLPVNALATEITAFEAKHSGATPIVVYCGTSKCPLADVLAQALINQYGFPDVRVMPGGYAEYRLAEAQAAAATSASK